MPRNNIRFGLKGGDHRSTGRSDLVATFVSRNLSLFPALISGLWAEDPLIRMRAADVAEKVTRKNHELLHPYRKQLLGLMADIKGKKEDQEMRWHLAVMVPRLPLDADERRLAADLLRAYLDDRSPIVRAFALQGLADLARTDRTIRPAVIEILRESLRTGTPAMKARSRRLLLHLERE